MQILQSSYTFSPPKMLQTGENIWYIWHIDGRKYFNVNFKKPAKEQE